MRKTAVVIAASVAALVVVGLLAGRLLVRSAVDVDRPVAPAFTMSAGGTGGTYDGFIFARVTTHDGDVYEGPVRWGGDQEAFWADHFNGSRKGNPWVTYVPHGRLPTEHDGVDIFGMTIGGEERPITVERSFLSRFGDISRIEAPAAGGRASEYTGDVQVTLKSGSVVAIERMDASDFDDGLRVWDRERGVVDLDPQQIRLIEFRPAAAISDAPARLHGTVRTTDGEFSGYVQWDREESFGVDTVEGRSAAGDVSVPFDEIRSIARQSPESALVTRRDGSGIVLSDGSDVGPHNRGIYVDDLRYGRVLISWRSFERVNFTPGDSGPGYAAFPPGEPLTGSVTTRDGRSLAGRLVYDLDESETTETLDAPSRDVSYTIPFGLVASIAPQWSEDGKSGPVAVALHNGEELRLDATGDLGPQNAGLLIFVRGSDQPEYVRWDEVTRIDLERPMEMYPPL